MENFFYGDKFYSDLGELMDDLDFNEECDNIPDDWSITCMETSKEPVFTLSPDWILDRVNEERFSEEGDELEKIKKALAVIDYEAVNKMIPSLHYPGGEDFTIDKSHLIAWCK